MKTTSAAALAAAAVMMGAGTSGAVSEPVEVNTSQAENRYWETVYTNEVDVVWRWDDCPTNAAYAEFLIDGMGGTVLTTNVTRSVSNVLWRAFATQSPAAEDVFDLRLTFFDSGNLVVGAQTSRLAVVKGAFGATQVDPGPAETTAWRKVKENVAVPYDAGWAKATVVATNSRLVIAKQGGITQTNTTADTAGYIGWKVRRSDWGYGTFNLALTFPGTEGEWDATLTRVPEGMKIQVR